MNGGSRRGVRNKPLQLIELANPHHRAGRWKPAPVTWHIEPTNPPPPPKKPTSYNPKNEGNGGEIRLGGILENGR